MQLLSSTVGKLKLHRRNMNCQFFGKIRLNIFFVSKPWTCRLRNASPGKVFLEPQIFIIIGNNVLMNPIENDWCPTQHNARLDFSPSNVQDANPQKMQKNYLYKIGCKSPQINISGQSNCPAMRTITQSMDSYVSWGENRVACNWFCGAGTPLTRWFSGSAKSSPSRAPLSSNILTMMFTASQCPEADLLKGQT